MINDKRFNLVKKLNLKIHPLNYCYKCSKQIFSINQKVCNNCAFFSGSLDYPLTLEKVLEINFNSDLEKGFIS